MNVPGGGALGGAFLPAALPTPWAGAGAAAAAALLSFVGVLARAFPGLAAAGEPAALAGLASRDDEPFLAGVPTAAFVATALILNEAKPKTPQDALDGEGEQFSVGKMHIYADIKPSYSHEVAGGPAVRDFDFLKWKEDAVCEVH
jgi:hypothetical protein